MSGLLVVLVVAAAWSLGYLRGKDAGAREARAWATWAAKYDHHQGELRD